MTLPSWLFALRRQQPQHSSPSGRRGATGFLSLPHDHLDTPVTRFYLLVWRGYQGLPFPTPNNTHKARVKTILDQDAAYSFSSFYGQTVIILYFSNPIRMPCNLYLDCRALFHLGQKGVQGDTRIRHHFVAICNEIEDKAERFGGLRGECLCEGPLDVFLTERALRDVTFRINFSRLEGSIENGGALWRCDGHSANLPILSREQHN
jgi:hypothetical protein